MRTRHASQVFEVIDEPPHSPAVRIAAGAGGSKGPEVGYQVLSPDEALRHLLTESRRQSTLGQDSEPDRIVRGADYLQGGNYPADNFVIGESVALGQPAGNTRAYQPLLQVPPEPMRPVQHRHIPPPSSVLGLISLHILDQPGYLILIGIEVLHLNVESRVPGGFDLLLEQTGVTGDQPLCGVEDLHRAATVPVQHDGMGEPKIVAEPVDDVWIRSSPGKDRLLVVAHPEEISMSLGQLADDAVLHRTQILKLVYQHVVPPASELGCRGWVGSQEPLGQNYQVVEVGQIAIAQALLIAGQ